MPRAIRRENTIWLDAPAGLALSRYNSIDVSAGVINKQNIPQRTNSKLISPNCAIRAVVRYTPNCNVITILPHAAPLLWRKGLGPHPRKTPRDRRKAFDKFQQDTAERYSLDGPNPWDTNRDIDLTTVSFEVYMICLTYILELHGHCFRG